MTLTFLSFHKDCFSMWCVYTCVVVHGYVYVHACKCVWGPEVDVSLLLFLFLRLNLELINWTRLAGSAPEIPLFLPLTLRQVYFTGVRNQTQVSMLAWQALY